MSEHLRIGIHELLRYVLPGYTFLFVLLLPFILTGVYEPLFGSWERFAVLFLFSGLVIGYLLYYPYYRIFIHCFYNEDNRISLRKARLLLDKKRVDAEVLAIHSIALHKTAEYRAHQACLFQFSAFHSIGVSILSILISYLISFTITLLQFLNHDGLLILEGVIGLILFFLGWILYSEYKYRLRLALRMEDELVMQNLEATIKETRKAWKKIQDILDAKEKKE